MIVSERDRESFAHHVLVNERHRFVFFSIPKVACTDWMRLFMRMRGVPDWHDDPHYRTDRSLLSDYSTRECTEILVSSQWLKAAFFRDPVERLLSAYLDKLVCRRSYAVSLFTDRDEDVSFDAFLSFVLDRNTDPSRPEGLHEMTNPHWRAQSLVGNIQKFAPVLDFVGRFSHLFQDARSLLRKRGLWEEFGATGWGPKGNTAFFEVNDALHATNARHLLSDYFSAEQIERVRRAYQVDYDLFERLNIRDVSVTTGQAL